MLSACAASTNGANTTRFSTALACAAVIRCAQADCGASLGEGLAIAPIKPRTMIRSRMYGIQMSPVSATVSVSQYNSVDISPSPAECSRPLSDELSKAGNCGQRNGGTAEVSVAGRESTFRPDVTGPMTGSAKCGIVLGR